MQRAQPSANAIRCMSVDLLKSRLNPRVQDQSMPVFGLRVGWSSLSEDPEIYKTVMWHLDDSTDCLRFPRRQSLRNGGVTAAKAIDN